MKILIIGPSWVGDTVMAQTLYKRLKEECPECKIDVISPDWSSELMQRMSEVSKTINSPYMHGDLKLLSRRQFGINLKKSNYDRSIVLTNSLKSSLIPFFARIPIRTGWLGEMRYGLLNDIRYLDKSKNHLMVEKFAALSIKDRNYSLESLSLPKLNIDFKNQKSTLAKLGINLDLPSLAICPGAEFGPSKKWPEEHYSIVAKHYINKGWNVLCFGSPNDHETGKKISNYEDLEEESHFYNLIGKTSLVDAVDLLSHCNKVVSNDSGLMHIAAAVETPLVAVYGPSSPEYTPPLIDKKVIIRKMVGYKKIREGNLPEGYDASLFSIKPEEVMEALEAL